MSNVTWAQRIKQRRLALGLTQGEVARRAGISVTSVCRIEQGKRGVSDALKPRLARAVEVSPDTLFAFEPAA